MNRSGVTMWVPALSVALTLEAVTARGQSPAPSGSEAPDSVAAAAFGPPAGIQTAIERHLGRPYVWGGCGLRNFDCSGFVWRVMQDNGVLIKRTTARKYYLSLPRVADEDRWKFGNLVFFDDLKHVGIVDTREAFYHAAVTTGTHRSRFDPLWRRKISGVRAMPRSGSRAVADTPSSAPPGR